MSRRFRANEREEPRLSESLTVVGLGGLLARISRSRAALELALEGAGSAGARATLIDLRELDLPMWNADADEPTAAAERLIESCHCPDGMRWSSPMYQARRNA